MHIYSHASGMFHISEPASYAWCDLMTLEPGKDNDRNSSEANSVELYLPLVCLQ